MFGHGFGAAVINKHARIISTELEILGLTWINGAEFIQNINLMRDAMAKKFTLIFSTSDYGMQLFDPDILKKTQGNLPVPKSHDTQGAGG